MSRSEVYQIGCDEDCIITFDYQKVRLKDYIMIEHQISNSNNIIGDIDYEFDEICNKLNEDFNEIVEKYYEEHPDSDLAIICERAPHSVDFHLTVTVHFDNLSDDESAECSSDDSIKHVLDEVMAHLDSFSSSIEYDEDEMYDPSAMYEPLDFYCVLCSNRSVSEVTKILNDYGQALEKLKSLDEFDPYGFDNPLFELSKGVDIDNFFYLNLDEIDNAVEKLTVDEGVKQFFKEAFHNMFHLVDELDCLPGASYMSNGEYGVTNSIVNLFPGVECFFSNITLEQ